MAKGFRGKYFSLAAITATTSQTTLHARFTAFNDHFALRHTEAEEEESPDDLELLEAITPAEPCYRLWGKKALHCNCIFRRSVFLALFVSKLKKLTPCRCRFRKSGLAPPRLLDIFINWLCTKSICRFMRQALVPQRPA